MKLATDLRIVCFVLLFAFECLSASGGGVFIPRNGGWEGRIGESHVWIDATSGGVMEVVEGEWPELRPLARVEMTFELTTSEGGRVKGRQSLDHGPIVQFLEEGSQRIGFRVKCRLYDQDQTYHGYGYNEAWMYPNGEIFVTASLGFEDALAHQGIADAQVQLQLSDAYDKARPGIEQPEQLQLPSGDKPLSWAFNDEALPGRQVLLTGEGVPPMGVYWHTGAMEHNTVIYRAESGAPSFYRWPDYICQTYVIDWQGRGTRDLRLKEVELRKGLLGLRWLARDAEPIEMAYPTFNSLFRIVTPADPETLRRLVSAESNPISPEIEGGVLHGEGECYNDQDGSYEFRKTDNPMVVRLPADPEGRMVRLKAVVLPGHGAVVTKLDGEPVVPQLASDGGIADDPLAPIRQHPEGPADMALVSVRLGEKPRTLTVSEEPGVQLVYQNRDPWRNVACFTSKGSRRWSQFRFSLDDGRVRYMRAYGKREFALGENLMHWFSWMGYTPQDMINQLVDFQILKNGPDEVIFRYKSANTNSRALSTYVVRVPYESVAMQKNVKAILEVPESWPYEGAQFFDAFPFRGVDPADWWYDSVLWVSPDGKVKSMDTKAWTYDGDTELEEITGGGFFALHSSDRGNMLMLTKNFSPLLPARHVVCANYIDFHMDLMFQNDEGEAHPPPKGYRAEMEYDLALWGGADVTRDQLVEIGKKSIKAGHLVLPEP